MDTKGGRYSVRINGQRFSGRGKASIDPAEATPKADPNRDGTAYRTVEPQLPMIALSFDRGSKAQAITWTAGMLLQDAVVILRVAVLQRVAPSGLPVPSEFRRSFPIPAAA